METLNEVNSERIICNDGLSSYEKHKINRRFIDACKDGDLELAKQIYNNNYVDIHYERNESFEWAVINNHINIVKWLVSIGDFTGKAFKNNVYPLYKACASGYFEMVKLLCRIDRDPIRWHGYEAIKFAFRFRRDNIVKWLIDTQLDKEGKDSCVGYDDNYLYIKDQIYNWDLPKRNIV